MALVEGTSSIALSSAVTVSPIVLTYRWAYRYFDGIRWVIKQPAKVHGGRKT